MSPIFTKIADEDQGNQSHNKEHFEKYHKKYKEYKYQEELTAKLDKYEEPFDENVINEITLWKVNRYPRIKDSSWYFEDEFEGELNIDGLIGALKERGIKIPLGEGIEYINKKILKKKTLYKKYPEVVTDEEKKSIDNLSINEIRSFNRRSIHRGDPLKSPKDKIEQTLLDRLNRMREVQNLEEAKKYKQVINALLECHGIKMPMASTYLRFLKPDIFQIIDVRAYRALTGDDTLDLSKDPVEKYFGYLDELKDKCEKFSIDFENADRILYAFDKERNGQIKRPIM